jgi:hypothetical protein
LWRSCILGAIVQLEDNGEDLSTPLRERGEELLRRLEGRGWIGFEESVRANVRAFILSEIVVDGCSGCSLGMDLLLYLWISSRLGNCFEEAVSDPRLKSH